MKSVLISIQPKWCELIASGKKTVEVRKTRPKIETPFKCYIYCTKPKKMFRMSSLLYSYSDNLIRNEVDGSFTVGDGIDFWENETPHTYLNGYVIGEFVCEMIEEIQRCVKPLSNFPYDIEVGSLVDSCLTEQEIYDYLNGGLGYGWHISDLKIYDKPRELSEFNRCCTDNVHSCATCRAGDYTGMRCTPITRPPQSWFYVKENEYARCGDSLKIMKEWENEK